MMKYRNSIAFWAGAAIFLIAVLSMTQIVRNEYPFFAGYVILQFIALAVAWNILGGYAGYVNFGAAAFFAVGSYTTVAIYKMFPLFQVPAYMIFVMLPLGGVVAALLGLATGALLTCSEKYGDRLPITRTAKVLRLDEQGFYLSFRIFSHTYGLQMEDVTETATGVELSTRLVLETRGFIREAPERDNKALIETLKQAWIRHKVEEIGNLERILPCMFSQEAVGWFGKSTQ